MASQDTKTNEEPFSVDIRWFHGPPEANAKGCIECLLKAANAFRYGLSNAMGQQASLWYTVTQKPTYPCFVWYWSAPTGNSLHFWCAREKGKDESKRVIYVCDPNPPDPSKFAPELYAKIKQFHIEPYERPL